MTSIDPTESDVSEPRTGSETSRRRRRRVRALLSLLVAIVGLLATYAGVGYQLFYRDHSDAPRKVDAIVDLGGEHDGREEYGLQLAREGYAKTVLISNPYSSDPLLKKYVGDKPDSQALMQRVCTSGTAEIEVICFNPDPSTTRGEAMFTQRVAKERHWHSVIVVSWRFHLVRARYIFGQCFDGDVVMRSVPRDYPGSPLYWGWQFAYQYGGIAKAAVLGCQD